MDQLRNPLSQAELAALAAAQAAGTLTYNIETVNRLLDTLLVGGEARARLITRYSDLMPDVESVTLRTEGDNSDLPLLGTDLRLLWEANPHANSIILKLR
jgi:hypothetical protein